MYAWESIQTTVNWMEEHLEEELNMEALAAMAALSPFYYQRLFKRLVKRTVGEYLKARRLAAAAERLRASPGAGILDTAIACGFGSHEGFTRSFKAAFGMTPEAYRSSPVSLNRLPKPELLLDYVMVDEDVPIITDGMVVEMSRRTLAAPRRFVGPVRQMPVDRLMGADGKGVSEPGMLWQRLRARKEGIPGLLPGGNELGALYQGGAPAGWCTYMAGVEVAPGTAPPEGLAAFTLPAREYVVCGFEAQSFDSLVYEALFNALRFTGRWMDSRGLVTVGFAAEMYYPPAGEVPYMEHWMPVRSSVEAAQPG